jgi:hypothetical protein
VRWALLCRRIAEGSSQGETGQFKCERHAVTTRSTYSLGTVESV